VLVVQPWRPTEAALVERYLFAKLKAEHATARGRQEARAQTRKLAQLPGAEQVLPGEPADAAALHAWDLSVVIRFADGTAAASALAEPVYLAFERYLGSAAQVVKAWSFVLHEE
jgi:hypothetical protein